MANMTTMPMSDPDAIAEADSTIPALTKIVATLGPASDSEEILLRLIDAGVSVFRLNFSHGELHQHLVTLERVRDAARDAGRPIAVLGDLQGPKIRVGNVAKDGVELTPGMTVIIQREAIEAAEPIDEETLRISSTYEHLVDDVDVGQRVLINDGAIRMLVVDRTDDELHCTVTVGGRLRSRKGINLPESELRVDPMTDRDWSCVDWAVEHDLDFLALSFVRRAEDVERLRDGLRSRVESRSDDRRIIPIVAKIELPGAVDRIESIADASEGIMVARGDLGVEMDLARLPIIQKRLVSVARAYGKPVIVATQMLESMITASSPTRAETTDVANAILDGADAVMLSGETAVGKHPPLVVDHMRRIAMYTEGHLAGELRRSSPPAMLRASGDHSAAVAHGVWNIVRDMRAKFVVVWSERGRMARLLSQNHFDVPVVAATTSVSTARQMQLYRGVTPVRMVEPPSLSEFSRLVDSYLLHRGWASPGDACVLVATWPHDDELRNNLISLHIVSDPASGFSEFSR